MRSSDVHPNLGPNIRRQYSIGILNVGGRHISEKRWKGLLEEVSSSSPKIIAVQEVGFWRGLNGGDPRRSRSCATTN